jgi:hypothetical protein
MSAAGQRDADGRSGGNLPAALHLPRRPWRHPARWFNDRPHMRTLEHRELIANRGLRTGDVIHTEPGGSGGEQHSGGNLPAALHLPRRPWRHPARWFNDSPEQCGAHPPRLPRPPLIPSALPCLALGKKKLIFPILEAKFGVVLPGRILLPVWEISVSFFPKPNRAARWGSTAGVTPWTPRKVKSGRKITAGATICITLTPRLPRPPYCYCAAVWFCRGEFCFQYGKYQFLFSQSQTGQRPSQIQGTIRITVLNTVQ